MRRSSINICHSLSNGYLVVDIRYFQTIATIGILEIEPNFIIIIIIINRRS